MAVPAARMYPAQVHIRSMDIILAPIASRVSHLNISEWYLWWYDK